MPGVAHTFGSPTHKEIHFSLDHIRNSAARARDEILGVLTHEVVHCFQFTGKGKAFPGGLGEGIAGKHSMAQSSSWQKQRLNTATDWVRLHAGLAPPHWREGSFDGLRARDGHVVSCRWRDGQVVEVSGLPG